MTSADGQPNCHHATSACCAFLPMRGCWVPIRGWQTHEAPLLGGNEGSTCTGDPHAPGIHMHRGSTCTGEGRGQKGVGWPRVRSRSRQAIGDAIDPSATTTRNHNSTSPQNSSLALHLLRLCWGTAAAAVVVVVLLTLELVHGELDQEHRAKQGGAFIRARPRREDDREV